MDLKGLLKDTNCVARIKVYNPIWQKSHKWRYII